MEKVTVVWSVEATSIFEQIYSYTEHEFGLAVANKLFDKVTNGVELIAANALIGKVQESLFCGDVQYRELIVFRQFKIIYYLENEVVTIATIWSCKQNTASKSFVRPLKKRIIKEEK